MEDSVMVKMLRGMVDFLPDGTDRTLRQGGIYPMPKGKALYYQDHGKCEIIGDADLSVIPGAPLASEPKKPRTLKKK